MGNACSKNFAQGLDVIKSIVKSKLGERNFFLFKTCIKVEEFEITLVLSGINDDSIIGKFSYGNDLLTIGFYSAVKKLQKKRG